jgi:ATP synthase F1 delta subunit
LNKNQSAKKFSRLLINTFDLKDIPGILDGIRGFSKLIDSSKELRLLFLSRIFTEHEKEQALKVLLSRLKVSQKTEKFLKLIIAQGYLNAIKEILKASVDAYNEKLKRIKAVVISPIALEENHIHKLKHALKSMTKREVDIDSQIDSSLLGGFVVKVGSTVYDSSLKGQFRLLREELTK